MESILILDCGSQYTQLIARKIRELEVYCEIHPWHAVPKISNNIKGVILSGSPCSVGEKHAPHIDMEAFKDIPVLGICFGAQYLAVEYGAEVRQSSVREYGEAKLHIHNTEHILVKGMDTVSTVWMSHGDTIYDKTDSQLDVFAGTTDVKTVVYQVQNKQIYGVQFHPEVYHTQHGNILLSNFIHKICKCVGNWTAGSFVENSIASIRNTIGTDNVILALSGGVDSSVVALLMHKAIGKQLYCIFIDNGLLREGEFEQVLSDYKTMNLNIKGINAKQVFYDALKGITDPEQKRKIIGKCFIDVFEKEASALEGVRWLAQGTIYPDIIESVNVFSHSSQTIKSHHNVGGLPERMQLRVIEPLKTLFKDEVRKIGKHLSLYPSILHRHPFPGPGLAIRILGNITEDKVHILQQADKIFIEGLKTRKLYDTVWQAGVMLLPVQSVGVMGDQRTYESVVVLRAVSSVDGMTAEWSNLPQDFLKDISNKIINTVKGINRVVYDISSKPPATIEWE